MTDRSDRVAVIGAGHVGLVTGACLAELGHHVVVVDNDAGKLEVLRSGGIPIFEPGLKELVTRNVDAGRLRFSPSVAEATEASDFIFIAVGTPPRPDGTADLSFLERVSRDVGARLGPGSRGPKIVVEKSTVPVNTGDQVKRTIQRSAPAGTPFEVASNPEFLREGSAVNDFFHPDRIVVGVESSYAADAMRRLYAPILDDPRHPEFVVTDVRSAELIKHASNSFLALKISFINAIANICELTGGNVEHVARGMGLDPRIGPSFLHAGIGYGGFCFPKDLSAFHRIAKDVGYDFHLLQEVMNINAQQRQRFTRKVEEALWVVRDKVIGVLGLAFKPQTDDIREAPALDILRWLSEQGARIKAYDPVAMEQVRALFPEAQYCTSAYQAAEGVDALLLVTEWEEFAALDLKRLRGVMRHPIVIDGRNIFSPDAMAVAGFEYYSVGRAPVRPMKV